MFAVIELAGHQYKVAEKDKIQVNRLTEKEGEALKIKKILLLADKENVEVGEPYLVGKAVDAKVLRHFRGEKVVAFKMKPKKRHMKKIGHRQDLTELEIQSIKS